MQKKYSQYANAAKALQGDGVDKYYAVSRFLFDAIIERNGKIFASEVYEKKIIVKERNFTEWRDNLCQKGWLIHCVEKGQNRNSSLYSAGPRLARYINKEIIKTKQLATTDFVLDQTKDAATTDFVTEQTEKIKKELDVTQKRLVATEKRLEETQVKLGETEVAQQELQKVTDVLWQDRDLLWDRQNKIEKQMYEAVEHIAVHNPPVSQQKIKTRLEVVRNE